MNIWRRFLIADNLRFSDLAYYLISIFSGQAEHLYSFKKDKTIYDCQLLTNDNDFYDDSEHLTAENYKLKDVLNLNFDICLSFEYDFGDSWKITLVFEDWRSGSKKFKVLDGAGFGLIENCGGTYALSEMADLKARNFPKFQKEYGDWLKDTCRIDPETIDFTGKIDVKAVNERATKDYPKFKKAYENCNR